MRSVTIKVTGKVQGVYFRATTKAIADQMGVRGNVMNEKDGSVVINAEGDNIVIEEMISWCHEGPDEARVENVEVKEGAIKNYRNFEVIKRR